MIPQNTLSDPSPIYSIYFNPDGDTITELTDVQLGGIGLSDASQGLQYQVWTLTINNALGDFTVSAPNTPPTVLFTRTNPIWGRLSFDQDMHPVISFVDQTGPHFYWWDPTIPGNTVTDLPSDVLFPCVTMDDKRNVATLLGWNDIILGYLREDNLCFRQQRDRYTIEYILLSNISTLIANPSLWKVGMNIDERLQFAIHGNLYQ